MIPQCKVCLLPLCPDDYYQRGDICERCSNKDKPMISTFFIGFILGVLAVFAASACYVMFWELRGWDDQPTVILRTDPHEADK